MSKKVTEITEQLVTPILESKGIELVDIEFKKEGASWFLRVFIDKEGGVDIEDCGVVSEELSLKLDETDPIPQAYFLEVSSPGAERPLKKEKDLVSAVGKSVYIKTYEPLEGRKEFEGTLKAFDGDQLTIEMKIKTRVKEVNIPYTKVASARLAVVF
ncbi:ribosome maturation factor RimP [Caldalkalibacillus mannanilyticus]|uniref:ribosome maturation factor RimP n=1 Tax=Caldalkalibacillus mannanilyticus TaxID=1418 RepID=UPI0004687F66|nr:ribosome maturation factor RimP [Caldalkalibacillus mannanilyticus]